MFDRTHKILKCWLALAALGCASALGAQTAAAPSTQSPAATAVPAQEWKTYSYADAGFSISYPSEPEIQKSSIPTEAGSFELSSYIAEIPQGALVAAVCDYGSALAGKDTGEALQGAKEGALANSHAHLISEKKITLGANPGLEFEAESETAHFSARIYLVGSKLYQMLIVSPINKPYSSAARFLDSFQLIAKAPK